MKSKNGGEAHFADTYQDVVSSLRGAALLLLSCLLEIFWLQLRLVFGSTKGLLQGLRKSARGSMMVHRPHRPP